MKIDIKDRCKEQVSGEGQWGWIYPHQCKNKIWDKYPEDGFCKTHHPITVQKRNELSEQRYEEKYKQSPWFKLKEAEKRIKELEEELIIAKRENILSNLKE